MWPGEQLCGDDVEDPGVVADGAVLVAHFGQLAALLPGGGGGALTQPAIVTNIGAEEDILQYCSKCLLLAFSHLGI